MVQFLFTEEKSIASKTTILLSLSNTSNSRLIKQNMLDKYHIIEDAKNPPADLNFDLCITDLQAFRKHKSSFINIKKAQPAYLPILLLVENNQALNNEPAAWDIVDDIIDIPLPKGILNLRIKNQMRSRQNSLQIVHQNKKLKLFEKALNSTNAGVLITDALEKDNPVIFANKGFEELTGYPKNEILGKNCRFMNKNNRNQPGLDLVRESIQKKEPVRAIIRNYKKDGSLFWNELVIAPIKNNTGVTTHFVGIQNDVTKLIETQEQLREEKKFHELMTENSTDLISRHSLDGTFLYVTPSSEQLTGYCPNELIGVSAYDFIHPDDQKRVKAAHFNIFEAKETAKIAYRIKSKDGNYKWVETISRLALEADNNFGIELQSATRDITERKKYEQELENSIDEKNVLLQEIHHRVKNNLAVISGLLQIQQFESNDETIDKVIGNSIARIKSMALIHEKLYRSKSLSHLEFDKYIEDLVHTIKKTQDYGNRIEIHVDCDKTILNVNQGVPCALILNEVISNAIEHAFIGRDRGIVWVSFKEIDDQIVASIKDNGVGIPNGILEKKRHSMGLTIIQTLIKQLNSTLEIKNNDGTEFSFTFKRQDISGAYSRLV